MQRLILFLYKNLTLILWVFREWNAFKIDNVIVCYIYWPGLYEINGEGDGVSCHDNVCVFTNDVSIH